MRGGRHGADKRCVCGASMAGRGGFARQCAPCAVERRRARERERMRRVRGTDADNHRASPKRIAVVTPATADLMHETRARLGWSYRAIADDFGVHVATAWRYGRAA